MRIFSGCCSTSGYRRLRSCASASASNLRAGVVGAGKRSQVEAELRLLLRRREQVGDLRRVAGIQFAGQADVSAGRRPRALRAERAPSSHAGAERSNATTYCSDEPVERGVVTRALQQIEQARATPAARVLASLSLAMPSSSTRARLGGLAVGVKQRGVFEHGAQARIGFDDLNVLLRRGTPFDQARGPVTVISRSRSADSALGGGLPGAAGRNLAAAAASRADAGGVLPS